MSIKMFKAEPSALWDKKSYQVKAMYKDLTAIKTIMEIDVLSVPDSMVSAQLSAPEDKALDTQNIPIKASMYYRADRSAGYNKTLYGDWDVRLVKMQSINNYVSLTDWETIDDNGEHIFDMDVSTLGESGGVTRIYVEGKLKSPVPEYQLSKYSRSLRTVQI